MKFQDLPADICTIRIKRTDNCEQVLQDQPVFSVDASLTHPNEFEIRLRDSVVLVEPVTDTDIRRLNTELASGRAILAKLANPAADGSIELQVAFFAGECLEMGDLEIGVDEYVERAVEKIAGRKLKGTTLYEALERQFCVVHGDKTFFFLTAGPAIDAALKWYDLSLIVVGNAAELTSESKSLVIIAKIKAEAPSGVDGILHIRIFDAYGKRLFDESGPSLAKSPELTYLQNLLNENPFPDPSKLTEEKRIEVIAMATFISNQAAVKTKSGEGSNEEDLKSSNGENSHSSLQAPSLKGRATRKNSFCVSGENIRFVATEIRLLNDKSVFIATRLTKTRSEPDRALRLAKGKLAFVDWTQAGRIQILTKAQMSALTQDDGSYLKKWDEFGDLEGELLLKHAREVGALQYCDMKQNRAGDDGEATVSIRISQASDSALSKLSVGGVEAVEITEELPDYLKNLNLKFADFVKNIEDASEQEDKLDNGKKRSRKSSKEPTHFSVNDFDVESKLLTLATESLPAVSGTLILSLSGEIAQIKRRMAARRAILEGRAVNPQLGPLIEEKGKIAPTRTPQKIRPLTAFVLEKVFPTKPPTLMQEKAIEVALNTPDIALIQGPPGTGKTTVIAAILERLNELADKRGTSTKGQVLLTGFQHDAVENMIDRLSLNSITMNAPVPNGRDAEKCLSPQMKRSGARRPTCTLRKVAFVTSRLIPETQKLPPRISSP